MAIAASPEPGPDSNLRDELRKLLGPNGTATVTIAFSVDETAEHVEVEASVRGSEASGVVNTHPGGQDHRVYWVSLDDAGFIWERGSWQQLPILPGYASALASWPVAGIAIDALEQVGTVERNGAVLTQLRSDAAGFFDLLYGRFPGIQAPIGSGELQLFVDEGGRPVSATAYLEMPDLFDPESVTRFYLEYAFAGWGGRVTVAAPSAPPRDAPRYEKPPVSSPTEAEECRRLTLSQEHAQMTDAQRRQLRAWHVLSLDGATIYLLTDGDHDAMCRIETLGGMASYEENLHSRVTPTAAQPIQRGMNWGSGGVSIGIGTVADNVAAVEVVMADGTVVDAEIVDGHYVATWQSSGDAFVSQVVAYDRAGREIGRS